MDKNLTYHGGPALVDLEAPNKEEMELTPEQLKMVNKSLAKGSSQVLEETHNAAEIGFLMLKAELLAITEKDGHLTIMRFTTGWKAMLGTPDLRSGMGADEISPLWTYPTLKEALENFLRKKTKLE